ncbi:unnamed protein product, partial [Amoebophrya sp. A120]
CTKVGLLDFLIEAGRDCTNSSIYHCYTHSSSTQQCTQSHDALSYLNNYIQTD